ncbi:MAG: flagellar biosynthetic protein FliR [Alphaproteobacteria bacterium]|nr:flagellar biosynthetic protein FliR [Alphaproteobacteria bacterium]
MLAQIFPQEIWVFFVVFMRLSVLLMLFPQIGRTFVPAQVRLLLALLLTFVITPIIAEQVPPLPNAIIDVLLVVLSEFLVGALIGTMARLALDSLTYAGTLIAFQIGLSNAAVFNPLQATQSILPAVFLVMMGVNMLFAVNFHHLLFVVLVESYYIFAPGQWHAIGDFTQVIVNTFVSSFTLGFRFALPFYFMSLIIYVMMGVAGRLMPQFQAFLVVLPLQIMLGWGLLIVILPTVMLAFLEYYKGLFEPFLPA